MRNRFSVVASLAVLGISCWAASCTSADEAKEPGPSQVDRAGAGGAGAAGVPMTGGMAGSDTPLDASDNSGGSTRGGNSGMAGGGDPSLQDAAEAGSAGQVGSSDAATVRHADAEAGTFAHDAAGGDVASGGGACMGLFCEDFESGKIDANVWSVKTSGGQPPVQVQKAKVKHGTYAAQFHANPNVLSYDLIMTKGAPMELRGHHFGRAYFYVTPKPPDQHATLLFAASAGFPTFKRLEVATIHSGWQLTSVNQTGITSGSAATAGTTETYAAGGTLPVEQWICLEWEFNDTPDQARIFVDGKEDFAFTNIVLDGKSTGQVGGFTDFGFGYYVWHPATYPFDVFYDDIVLDTKRVGCLP